jgi:hypothetical protein
MLTRNTFLASTFVIALSTFAAPAGAATYQANATLGDGPVSGQAVVTLNTNSIVIQLTNLLANPTSAGQLLSGIQFNVSGASGSGLLTSSSVAFVTTINANGTYSPAVSDPLTRWEATETGTLIKLTTLSGGNPDRLVIGNPDGNNLYSAANASIIGDNPNVVLSPTFTITAPGVIALSAITNVVFLFGTTPYTTAGVCIDCGDPSPGQVPLPAAVFLFGSTLAGAAGLAGWRRRRRSA